MQEEPLGELRGYDGADCVWCGTDPRKAIFFLQYHIASSLTPKSLGWKYTHVYV